MTLKEAIKKYDRVRRACWKSSPVLNSSYITVDACDDFIDETGMYEIFNLAFLDDDWEEYREPILTDKEKEYLQAVIKPFRDRLHCIRKVGVDDGRQFISIEVEKHNHKDDDDEYFQYEDIEFPYFDGGTMYANMEADRKYTLEELGL